LIQNLHTHTVFSDGSDNPEKYVEAAMLQGLNTLGFSDHSPLPFENVFALPENQVRNYCDAILSLRDQLSFKGNAGPRHTDPNSEFRNPNSEFRIFLGMEVDFIPGTENTISFFRENFPLDYVIGSVHLVGNGSTPDLWFIDGPDPATYDKGLNALFGGDIRKGVSAYYRQINEMLATSPIDILGHIDKIKMHNRGRFFLETEPWYVGLVNETLDLARHSGIIVEVNTRGLYKKRSESLFPGPVMLKKIHDLKIPVIISSDAHKPSEISMLFSETANLLFDIGFRELMSLSAAGWEKVPLRNYTKDSCLQ
jgi:histidinol-phosphatase (PHP family)